MDIKTRLSWVQLYEQTKDFGLVCRRCGISRPTLRKWWRRYLAQGKAGLQEISRRPHKILQPKVTEKYEQLILDFRRLRNLGARRIQAELIRHHNFKLSTKTLEKVLRRITFRQSATIKTNRRFIVIVVRFQVTVFKSTPSKSPTAFINTRQSMTAHAFVFSAFTQEERLKTAFIFSKRE